MPKSTETIETPATTNEVVSQSPAEELTEALTQDAVAEENKCNCEPPNVLQRNDYGLLIGVNYFFDEDGYVDWRKMIDPKFLVAQKDAPNKPVEELKDSQLIILLGGIKKLARIRGFREVRHKVITASPHYVAVATTITWRKNYETSYEDVEFTALADAHGNNTEGFTTHYLASIAENRGFVRAVRNFLNINITGKEELGAKDDGKSSDSAPNGKAREILAKLLEINGIDFERFKNRMIKKEVEGAEDWENLNDISEAQVLEVIAIVEEVLESAKKKS